MRRHTKKMFRALTHLSDSSWQLLRFGSWWNRKTGCKNRFEMYSTDKWDKVITLLSYTCTYSLAALCPLSVPHPHPPHRVVPSSMLCPLLQWPRRESRAGWRVSWRERGASSLKTTWRCCSLKWKYLLTSWKSAEMHAPQLWRSQ